MQNRTTVALLFLTEQGNPTRSQIISPSANVGRQAKRLWATAQRRGATHYLIAQASPTAAALNAASDLSAALERAGAKHYDHVILNKAGLFSMASAGFKQYRIHE